LILFAHKSFKKISEIVLNQLNKLQCESIIAPNGLFFPQEGQLFI